jgi:uncharacterized protein YutE (UPF0331/DUF86 family)
MRIDTNRLRQYLTEIIRNSLVHRYWTVDDEKLIENIKAGLNDFGRFADEVEAYLVSAQK